MKIIYAISFILLLNNCAGGNVAKIKFGKRCTISNAENLQESSYIWFISKDALENFDKRINKKNCLKS
mgnify:FL=1|tara:strand:+ start:756 stop:959 length:204 start_codon:yes stop_codon:yes gene_type:complete